MNATQQTEILINELQALRESANVAYLTFYAALLNAPSTPEFNRLRTVLDNLRKSVVHTDNHLKTVDAMPCIQA